MNDLVELGRFDASLFSFYDRGASTYDTSTYDISANASASEVLQEDQATFRAQLLRSNAEQKNSLQDEAILQDAVELLNAMNQYGVFVNFTAQDSSDLNNILESGTVEDLATFLYERTGFSDDPKVSDMFKRIFSNDEVSMTELGRLGAALAKSVQSRSQLIIEFARVGLFENLNEQQKKDLDALMYRNPLIDVANYMFENAGFSGDPRVIRVMERLRSDDEVTTQDLSRLGGAMERSRDDRLEFIDKLNGGILINNLSNAQRNELTALILSGDPKDIAIFLHENSGSIDDPRVASSMERILADESVTVSDVSRLSSTLERSRASREDLLSRYEKDGLLNDLTAEQKNQLAIVSANGSFEDLAVFLFENTGYSEDPEVINVMQSIRADGSVTPKDIGLLGSAIEDAKERAEELQQLKEDAIELLDQFEKIGLLDNLTQTQLNELKEITNTSTLNEVANYLYQNTGLSDDPDVAKTLERIFSDDEITLRDLDRLGDTMEHSRNDRIKLINDFEKDGLLDKLTDAQQNEIEALAKNGSLKELATFLFDNSGYMDDPAVTEAMSAVLSDDVVILSEIKQLGAVIKDSRENRVDIIKDFERAGLLESLSSSERNKLEDLAVESSIVDMATYLYENLPYSDDPDVVSAMNSILSDRVVSIKELEQLGEAMEQSMDSRADLVREFNRADILDDLNTSQKRQFQEIADGGSLKDMAVFLFENTGFSANGEIGQVMDSILSDNVVSIQELRNLGAAIKVAMQNP